MDFGQGLRTISAPPQSDGTQRRFWTRGHCGGQCGLSWRGCAGGARRIAGATGIGHAFRPTKYLRAGGGATAGRHGSSVASGEKIAGFDHRNFVRAGIGGGRFVARFQKRDGSFVGGTAVPGGGGRERIVVAAETEKETFVFARHYTSSRRSSSNAGHGDGKNSIGSDGGGA